MGRDRAAFRARTRRTVAEPKYHDAGQFAFITFDPDEGAHPFTISSGWQGDGRLFVLIKGIGDYTDRLPELLQGGDVVTVEGPYGRFAFAGGKARQIWVAGGIGITPFIGRMKALAVESDGREVDLFYSTGAPDEDVIARLRRDAEAAKVRLHGLVAAREGRLDVARICKTVPAWASADIWFCGPGGFGQTLREGFTAGFVVSGSSTSDELGSFRSHEDSGTGGVALQDLMTSLRASATWPTKKLNGEVGQRCLPAARGE